MEALRAWAATLCVLSVAVAALRMLAPRMSGGSAGLSRLLRLLIGAVFLCAALTPLLSLRGMLAMKVTPQTEEEAGMALREQLRKQVETQANAALAKVADEVLAVYHLSVGKIEAQVDIGEDGGIYITSITVTLDKRQARNEETIRRALAERLGQEVKVVTEG